MATVALVMSAGCGGSSDGTPPTDSARTADTSASSETPTDTVDSRLPLADETDLVILGSDEASVEQAVSEFGGTLLSSNDGGVFEVRFPVTSLEELREIESALEALGFNVQLDFADEEPAAPGEDS